MVYDTPMYTAFRDVAKLYCPTANTLTTSSVVVFPNRLGLRHSQIANGADTIETVMVIGKDGRTFRSKNNDVFAIDSEHVKDGCGYSTELRYACLPYTIVQKQELFDVEGLVKKLAACIAENRDPELLERKFDTNVVDSI